MKRLFAAALLVCVAGCGPGDVYNAPTFHLSDWEQVSTGTSVAVLTDKDTGRQYLVVDGHRGVGVTERLPPIEEPVEP